MSHLHGIKSFLTVRVPPPDVTSRVRGCLRHAPGWHHQIQPNAKTVHVEVSHRMLRVAHLRPDLVWPCAAQELTRFLRRSSPGCDMQVGQMRAEPVWPASVLTSRPGVPRPAERLPPHMCATTPSSFVVVRVRTELRFRRRWHSGARARLCPGCPGRGESSAGDTGASRRLERLSFCLDSWGMPGALCTRVGCCSLPPPFRPRPGTDVPRGLARVVFLSRRRAETNREAQ